jgi:protein SCO1/2
MSLRIVATLLGAAALSACAAAVAATSPGFKAGVFDPPRQAPDFALQGSNGQPLQLSHYRGKVVLLAFGYSSCTAVCPITLNSFAVARRKLGAAARDVQIVYVTVDPERDGPGRLQKFLSRFDPTFVGGTGSEPQLEQVRKDYGVSARKTTYPNHTYAYEHSSFSYLIDRSGRLRALMPYGHSPDDFVNDLSILLKE